MNHRITPLWSEPEASAGLSDVKQEIAISSVSQELRLHSELGPPPLAFGQELCKLPT